MRQSFLMVSVAAALTSADALAGQPASALAHLIFNCRPERRAACAHDKGWEATRAKGAA